MLDEVIGKIQIYSPDGIFLRGISDLLRVNSVAVNKYNEIFVINDTCLVEDNHVQIKVFSSEGNFIASLSNLKLDDAGEIAINSRDEILITNGTKIKIYKNIRSPWTTGTRTTNNISPITNTNYHSYNS